MTRRSFNLDDRNLPRLPRRVEWWRFPAGSATLGLVKRGIFDFGWDNEFEPQRVEVPAFRIDTQNVTNGEFLEFIRLGAYDNPAFWTEPDWGWKTSQGITHPGFWLRQGGEWNYRTMFAEIPAAARLARVREPCGSVCIRSLARKGSPHGSSVSPRSLWNSRGDGAPLSLGR